MRRLWTSLLAGLCWLAATASGGFTQERTLDENLRDLNQRLRAYGFEDDGQQTYSQIFVRGDRVIAEVTNIRGGTRTINIYDAAVADLQPQRIRMRTVGPYIELAVPARGDVTSRLRCENPNGTSHEWSLPATSQLALQVRPESREAEQVRVALATVIRQAQERLATT